MSLSKGYHRLAALVEALEAAGIDVADARPVAAESGTIEAVDSLTATVTVELPLDDDSIEPLAPVAPDRPGSDGAADEQRSASTGVSSDGPGDAQSVEPDDPDADATPGEATRADGDTPVAAGAPPDEPAAGAPGPSAAADGVPCDHPDCEDVFGTAHGMRIHHAKVHDGADAPHRDPERLREVYERHETFDAMRDALDTPVTSNTVRRQLVEHGIHDPGVGSRPDSAEGTGDDDEDDTVGDRGTGDGAATGEDADDDAAERDAAPAETARGEAAEDGATDDPGADTDAEETAAAGAAGLFEPTDRVVADGVTAAELHEVVRDAKTVRDVQTALSLDREATMELLSRFDLLPVVHGRVATEGDREALRSEIGDRIRENLDEPADRETAT